VILRSTNVRSALRSRQRGLLLNPFRFGGGGGGSDPNFANVSLLLHMDGSDGSTTFADNSPSPRTMTANGNAQIDTAQSKFGGASGLFDGSGDWVSTPSNAAFNFGTGDFTIECWARPANVTNRMIISGQINSATTEISTSVIFEITAAGFLRSYAYSGTTLIWNITGTTALSANTWAHFAVCRSGTTVRIFVDGVVDGTATSVSASVNSSSTTFSIGRGGEFNGLYWNGHLDDFRVTKGVARYTANFTPPAAAFPNS
jgi:hypothetical protein